MFADMLFCADCGSKLWYHINSINHIRFFICSHYKTDYRGSCPTRHYIRADSLEEVIKLELRRLTGFLAEDAEGFAQMLAEKTTTDAARSRRQMEEDLKKALYRKDEVERLYERLYEDNFSGKVSDEWFARLPRKYEAERFSLKGKIQKLHETLAEAATAEQNLSRFLAIVEKFMDFEYLTPVMLRELIDHIDVHETEGTGKNRCQQIDIYYRFVGELDIPFAGETYREHIRQGVDQTFITRKEVS